MTTMSTNQSDDVSLESVVRAAERAAAMKGSGEQKFKRMAVETPVLPIPSPTIWSDATYAVTAAQRGEVARVLTEGAEGKGMLSAGYLEMRIGMVSRLDPGNILGGLTRGEGWARDTVRYDPYSQAQCSMTVRHPKGVGSGWAGLSSYDWTSIDAPLLAQRALDKCLTSLNPVAIEPGRYTTILEPTATCALVNMLFSSHTVFSRTSANFLLGYDPAIGARRTKLGLKIMDERITLRHSQSHPSLGVIPFADQQPITWVENGILTTLDYGRQHFALTALNRNDLSQYGGAVEMVGGDIPMEEMISSTQRGLLVTRFSGVSLVDSQSLLHTGLTRDGLWLIENGKITKAVKNFRFTESPMFALNQVEQLGQAVPVFRPALANGIAFELTPAIVPAIKIRDFSFTSMVDAV